MATAVGIQESTPASSASSMSSLPPELAENTPSFHGLIGRSPAMRHLILQMERVASHVTVATIEGEDGTGRTLAAYALHTSGPAALSPFIPCPAAQFFAPTLPADDRSGWSAALLRQAHGGTLFLDRVHQLSPEQQQRLADFLHWFDDRHARQSALRLTGEDDSPDRNLPRQLLFSSSVTLRHPETSVSFREDLASWLCAVRFRLPSLRERREDIPLLAQIFIQRFARTYGKPVRGLGPGTIAPLLRHSWPGNVRELEEVITAAAHETQSQWIRPIDLPPLLPAIRKASQPVNSSLGGSPTAGIEQDVNLDRAIRNHVVRVLEHTRGNKLRAAQLLGISRSTLYRILAVQEPASPEAER